MIGEAIAPAQYEIESSQLAKQLLANLDLMMLFMKLLWNTSDVGIFSGYIQPRAPTATTSIS